MRIFGKKPKISSNLVNLLGQQGYRMTPQRLMIVDAIENSTGHISADEVYSQVLEKYPNVNISTVYRTLDLLEEKGMVTKTNMGDGVVRYHPSEKGHHHHLVCKDCGTIIDLNEEALADLKESLLKKYDFMADLHHLGITGRCVRCSQNKLIREGSGS